ncbi:MAG: hypothetical protein K6347_06060 [Campylobacterales bacterium]
MNKVGILFLCVATWGYSVVVTLSADQERRLGIKTVSIEKSIEGASLVLPATISLHPAHAQGLGLPYEGVILQARKVEGQKVLKGERLMLLAIPRLTEAYREAEQARINVEELTKKNRAC